MIIAPVKIGKSYSQPETLKFALSENPIGCERKQEPDGWSGYMYQRFHENLNVTFVISVSTNRLSI